MMRADPDRVARTLDSGREAGQSSPGRDGGRAMSERARFLVVMVMLGGLAAALSACGDTWRGLKEDTGENLEKTGETLEKAGDKVTP
jgi:hypothetical protein